MKPLYQHFRCSTCNHEVYILTDDRNAKAYCRKCSIPMTKQVIGKLPKSSVRGSKIKRRVLRK